jgi:hypothetical protein
MPKTTVNPQITDSVTQVNTKAVAESPAIAMGEIYQSIANAIGQLFENAVTAQQDQDITALAAANQGIILIYNASSAAQAEGTAAAVAQENSQQRAHQALEAARLAGASASAAVAPQVEAAIKLANEATLGHAGEFAYALRANSEAMAAALRAIDISLHQNLMRTLRMAATAACLEAMLRNPDKAEAYSRVLQAIEHLE